MKSNQLNTIIIYLLLFFLIGCSSGNDEIIVQVEEENVPTVELKDKRFFINQTIAGENVAREVILKVPITLDTSRNYPVVFAFHGRGTDNDSWVNKLNHLMALGEFVGVYPQGYEKMWNSGGNESSKADDINFVGDIIDALKDYKNLDFKRIYAIGTSNGSSMTNKLALETSYFSAVASIVSQLSQANLPNKSTNPTAVFQINGAADKTIPIDGGPKLGYVFLEAFESAKSWASAFKCDNFQLQNLGDDKLYVFPNCLDGKEIRYLRIENGEHNLHWGRPELLKTVWDFLKRF
jgi:poly(3-hydroxybutyrate) depolymerase